MFADSEKEKDEWIGVIGRAIVQVRPPSTTFRSLTIVHLSFPFRYHSFTLSWSRCVHLHLTVSPPRVFDQASSTLIKEDPAGAAGTGGAAADDSEEETDVPFNPNA